MTTKRIEALTDGIYAIAMTILILNIKAPSPTMESETLIRSLIDQVELFYDYFLAFFLLALFWVASHRQFHFIRNADNTFLWISILQLMFVVIIPYTTLISGKFRTLQPAAVLFEMNILAVGLIMSLLWYYATNNRKLVDKNLKESVIKLGKRRGQVSAGVSIVAIAFSFVSPENSTLVYLSLPVLMRFVGRTVK